LTRGSVAQLVEHGAFNTKAAGSSPATPTTQQVLDEVYALHFSCNDTGYGRARQKAYQRVIDFIEGRASDVNWDNVFPL
jgi:hypothetical protein